MTRDELLVYAGTIRDAVLNGRPVPDLSGLNERTRLLAAALALNSRRGMTHLPGTVNSFAVERLLGIPARDLRTARWFLKRASDDEFQRAQEGKISLHLARTRAANTHPGTAARIANQRLNAEIWANLRTALTALAGLPLPADVAEIIRSVPGIRNIVDDLAPRGHAWLASFIDAWNAPRDP